MYSPPLFSTNLSFQPSLVNWHREIFPVYHWSFISCHAESCEYQRKLGLVSWFTLHIWYSCCFKKKKKKKKNSWNFVQASPWCAQMICKCYVLSYYLFSVFVLEKLVMGMEYFMHKLTFSLFIPLSSSSLLSLPLTSHFTSTLFFTLLMFLYRYISCFNSVGS